MPDAPVDLDTIKDDLGIAAGDSSHDAWLQRRVNGVWSRFQQYTGRPLTLSAAWADDWGELVQNHPGYTEPPLIRALPSASVFLRVFPVQQVTRLVVNDVSQDPTSLMFDRDSGKLLGLGGHPWDLRTFLPSARVRIEYAAGFLEVPSDLYEALLGAVQVQWNERQASQAGVAGAGFLPSRISVQDVGEVDINLTPNFFVEQAMRHSTSTDPLIAAWATLLDPYVDWRSLLGGSGAYPTTVPLDGSVPVPPPPTTISETPPPYPRPGDRWFNSADGREYLFYDDGDSQQWVQADTAG